MFPRFVIIIIVLAAIAKGQVPQLEPTITIRSNSPSKDFTGTKQRQGPECDLPAEKGTCSGKLNRYYYDSSSGKCKKFSYTGCGGNLNNFDTLSECNQRCICSRPVDEGTCDNRKLRYFYNQATGLCQLFIYGGCDGNNNRFRTEEACNNVCKTEDVRPRCLKRPEYGHCSNETERFYYDSNCKCCQTFQYSGCKGNNNNFKTEQQCLNRCSSADSAATSAADSVTATISSSTSTDSTTSTPATTTSNLPARCLSRRDKGPCNSKIVRYYFDEKANNCKYFLWGGCGGNSNNFRSRRFCVQTCVQ